MGQQILLILLSLFMISCHTIHYKASSSKQTYSRNMWSHGVFDLVEITPPANLKRFCNGSNWTAVKTEQSFVQGLLQNVSWGIYTPQGVAVACESPTNF